MYEGWSGLFPEIVTSSIWSEDDKTRIVWITMLALKDRHGEVPASIPGLAAVARVDIKDCEKAIAVLEGPDKYSRSKNDEGRRIRKIDGGWLVINHKKWREKLSRDYTATERQRRHRENEALNSTVTDRDKSVTDRDLYVCVSASDSSLSMKDVDASGGVRSQICEWFKEVYNRKVTFRMTYEEEFALVEVSKRPDALEELKDIRDYFSRTVAEKKKYLPHSGKSCLLKWSELVDQARSTKPKEMEYPQ